MGLSSEWQQNAQSSTIARRGEGRAAQTKHRQRPGRKQVGGVKYLALMSKEGHVTDPLLSA